MNKKTTFFIFFACGMFCRSIEDVFDLNSSTHIKAVGFSRNKPLAKDYPLTNDKLYQILSILCFIYPEFTKDVCDKEELSLRNKIKAAEEEYRRKVPNETRRISI